MKIKLVYDLPIEPKHGAKRGREFTVTRILDHKFFCLGDAGEQFGVMGAECAITDTTDRPVEEMTPPPPPKIEKAIRVYTEEEQIELAGSAIAHVLQRIANDKRIAYHFCPATESYSRLAKAYAAIFGEKWDDEDDLGDDEP